MPLVVGAPSSCLRLFVSQAFNDVLDVAVAPAASLLALTCRAAGSVGRLSKQHVPTCKAAGNGKSPAKFRGACQCDHEDRTNSLHELA